MNPKILIGGIAVVVLLLVLVPLISGGNGGGPAQTPQETESPEPAAEPAPAPFGEQGAQQAPAAPAGPQNMTAQDLQNTTWQFQQYQITFLPNGVVQANVPGAGQVQGTWSVSGNRVNASAMGQSITAQIQGNQLFVDGQPLQRLQ